jgi:hypothetical protein
VESFLRKNGVLSTVSQLEIGITDLRADPGLQHESNAYFRELVKAGTIADERDPTNSTSPINRRCRKPTNPKTEERASRSVNARGIVVAHDGAGKARENPTYLTFSRFLWAINGRNH